MNCFPAMSFEPVTALVRKQRPEEKLPWAESSARRPARAKRGKMRGWWAMARVDDRSGCSGSMTWREESIIIEWAVEWGGGTHDHAIRYVRLHEEECKEETNATSASNDDG